jgi:endonuclease/exonuclease/phosphatase family metal-dependent hydrolase
MSGLEYYVPEPDNRKNIASCCPIKIATFNAENFYMLLDRDYSSEEFGMLSNDDYLAMNKSIYNRNKDLDKIGAIASTILDEDFDIVGLCEVGGLETLVNFNRYYLDNRYECHLHQENSNRGIFAGALVRVGRFSSVTAKNMAGTFSRNLLKLTLRQGRTELIVFVVHLKSQYGEDLGIEKRIREVRQLTRLLRRRRCIVMGDFNGILIRGEHQFEFEPLLELPFRDVQEALGVPIPQRFTHFYFGAKANFSQLDYILCSDDIEVLDGGVIADMIPLNYEQRSRLPSDHLFLKATIRINP